MSLKYEGGALTPPATRFPANRGQTLSPDPARCLAAPRRRCAYAPCNTLFFATRGQQKGFKDFDLRAKARQTLALTVVYQGDVWLHREGGALPPPATCFPAEFGPQKKFQRRVKKKVQQKRVYPSAKARSWPGLDCLVCATFARQRPAQWASKDIAWPAPEIPRVYMCTSPMIRNSPPP